MATVADLSWDRGSGLETRVVLGRSSDGRAVEACIA